MTASVLSHPPARISPAQRREIWATVKAFLYLSPSLLIFVTFIFYPLLQSIRLSMYAADPIGRPIIFVGLEQYQRLLPMEYLFFAVGSAALILHRGNIQRLLAGTERRIGGEGGHKRN